jgi:hypothetical protein
MTNVIDKKKSATGKLVEINGGGEARVPFAMHNIGK